MKSFSNRICAMNTHYRYYSLDYFLDSCIENDIKFIELWTCSHHFYLGNDSFVEPEELKQKLDEKGLYLKSICPEQNNPKLHNVASDNLLIQDKTVKYFTNAIKSAKYLNCPVVLITPGWARYDEPKKDAWDRSVQMLERICKVAKRHNVFLALEALQPNESSLVNNINDLLKIREEVNSERLKICLDFGAMARAGESIAMYFESFGQDIIHVHFVDGNPTGHLAWGDGCRNVFDDLKQLSRYAYKGYLSLEYANDHYFDKAREVDSYSIKNIRRQIDD